MRGTFLRRAGLEAFPRESKSFQAAPTHLRRSTMFGASDDGTASLFAAWLPLSDASWHAPTRCGQDRDQRDAGDDCTRVLHDHSLLVARLAETELLHLELQSLARNFE